MPNVDLKCSMHAPLEKQINKNHAEVCQRIDAVEANNKQLLMTQQQQVDQHGVSLRTGTQHFEDIRKENRTIRHQQEVLTQDLNELKHATSALETATSELQHTANSHSAILGKLGENVDQNSTNLHQLVKVLEKVEKNTAPLTSLVSDIKGAGPLASRIKKILPFGIGAGLVWLWDYFK